MSLQRSAPSLRPRSSVLAGMGLMAIAMLAYPNMDALAKLLSRDLPVLEIVWARYMAQSLVLLPFVIWQHGRLALKLREGPLQVVRSGLHLLAGILFFSALSLVPLADCVATFFVSPLIITALSVPLLAERLGPWRVGAVVAGFIGILLIVRPGFAAVSYGLLLALGAGCAHALFAIASRKLAGSDPPLIGTFVIGLIGSVVLGCAMPFVWVWPDHGQWALLAAVGLIAAFCQLLVIMAYEHAPASQLAPFAYLEMVSATILGLLLFGDFPTAITWLGIVIVIASGTIIAWRERLRARS